MPECNILLAYYALTILFERVSTRRESVMSAFIKQLPADNASFRGLFANYLRNFKVILQNLRHTVFWGPKTKQNS
jgi:hypothetical protein